MHSRPRLAWTALTVCFALASLPLDYGKAAAPPRVHALKDARVVVAPGRVLQRATVVLRDGIIVAVGKDAAIPADARVWAAESLTVYPGLIEPYLRLDALVGRPEPVKWAGPSDEPPAPGAGHPHPRVRADLAVTDGLEIDPAWWEDYRALGFAAAWLAPADGVFRGRGALLSLRAGRAADLTVAGPGGQCLAYDTGDGPDGYPRSLMGVVALQRQTLLDAAWQAEAEAVYAAGPRGLERPETNAALAALADAVAGEEPVFVETTDVLSTLRAGALAREFGLRAVLVGNGEERKRPAEIAALGLPLILPVAFPDPPAMERAGDAWDHSLAALRAWDAAPSNPAACVEADLSFSLSTQGLREPARFFAKLRAAIARGLDPDRALAALTLEPARLHGVADRLGTVAAGKIANLAVADGDLFARGTRVVQLWVDGEPHDVPLEPKRRDDPRGLWRLELAEPGGGLPRVSWLRVGGGKDAPTVRWSAGENRLPPDAAEAERGADSLRVAWPDAAGDLPRALRLVRDAGGARKGWLVDAQGEEHAVRALRRGGPPPAGEERPPEPPTPRAVTPGPVAEPETVVVQGATVWTQGPSGVMDAADMLVSKGRIVAVGHGIRLARGATVVDARGMHLTPGIMDCHSHAFIVGDVNEGTLASSAMVRIEDVVNSESDHVYRHLAGGVTLENLLHGSANPIGGQNAVVKLRWGGTPAAMLLADAAPNMKWALGENVTQKSWGDGRWRRYPKTRMGVEQFIRDRLAAARDYGERIEAYAALSRGEKQRIYPVRRDLELEALLEVLRDERDVHCHAYRQDEMLMLLRVAEDFGFGVDVLVHALEGYKVANEIAAHGAAATAFSDWWAYKPEVYDAIPYAGAIMRDRGVLVTYNSDSAELARRLNLEAAKAVRYGGVDEADALGFVTLNVAKQLGLEDRIGSLEPGKDADFVLWSGHPLDAGSICLQTWVDGKLYFDRETDLERRTAVAAERDTLVAKALRAAVDDDRGGGAEEGRQEYRTPDYRLDRSVVEALHRLAEEVGRD